MRVGIPIYDGVDVLDLTGGYEMFRWAGFDNELLAERAGLIVGNGGLTIKVDKAFNPADDYDLLSGCRAAVPTGCRN